MITRLNEFRNMLIETAEGIPYMEGWLRDTWGAIASSGIEYDELVTMLSGKYGQQAATVFADDRYRAEGGLADTYGDGSTFDTAQLVDRFEAIRGTVDAWLASRGVQTPMLSDSFNPREPGELMDTLKRVETEVGDRDTFRVDHQDVVENSSLVVVYIAGKPYEAHLVDDDGFGNIWVDGYTDADNTSQAGDRPGFRGYEQDMLAHFKNIRKDGEQGEQG